jgi:hypothetical protein
MDTIKEQDSEYLTLSTPAYPFDCEGLNNPDCPDGHLAYSGQPPCPEWQNPGSGPTNQGAETAAAKRRAGAEEEVVSEAPRDATAAVNAPLTPRRPQGSDPDEVRNWFDGTVKLAGSGLGRAGLVR